MNELENVYVVFATEAGCDEITTYTVGATYNIAQAIAEKDERDGQIKAGWTIVAFKFYRDMSEV